ncbi:30S ribosome-binding factor RbfA [Aerococcaceae bacterium NML191292]|nr:30S ribosome-binding factor RbfA [Aerococcaceae bacterium NML210727]MCW6655290.1 30S ribosome-binding factor RbfA [Aerococcaceae bacterium NML201296]MCW6660279.1 30S ribosome-binding factor RbfA [Aerococcaceae bacterium NML191292]MCW6661524.1 30S ribosome-binding factor RbfA [Aerococcaceae bacterium NML201209]MCW6663822.1 30S ribosome-binding factor RbfA [Aerococcaceae bacterium NML190073]MCW6665349.1 30S ribosome-binding factor RbfA [Aerococcaceae bacterium NML191219]MCW6667353.1 30S ribo
MANYRVGRVRQEILREVNNIFLREVKDPRIEGVTITDVDLTGDLQQATIYYSTLSDKAGERQKTEAGLKAVTGLVRSELGKRLKIYKTPEIKFERDASVDYGNRIDTLLNKIKSETSEETE